MTFVLNNKDDDDFVIGVDVDNRAGVDSDNSGDNPRVVIFRCHKPW